MNLVHVKAVECSPCFGLVGTIGYPWRGSDQDEASRRCA